MENKEKYFVEDVGQLSAVFKRIGTIEECWKVVSFAIFMAFGFKGQIDLGKIQIDNLKEAMEGFKGFGKGVERGAKGKTPFDSLKTEKDDSEEE